MSKMEVPKNAVSDSEKALVYVTGDILAPALENVGNLVRLPNGCGKKNIVGLVPNSSNQEKPDLVKKAKKYMET